MIETNGHHEINLMKLLDTIELFYIKLKQWFSNFLARGTLKRPENFRGTPKYV
jgi:pyruvate-formate lyase-activating enzyme